jgi:hypothetical protein
MSFAIRTVPLVAAIALLAGMSGGLALAPDAQPGRSDLAEKFKQRFAAAAKNGNGKLTKAEAKAGMPFVYQHFEAIDMAHVGAIKMADIAVYAREKRAAKPSGD